MILRSALLFVVGALVSCAAWSETKPVEMVVSLKSAKTIIVRAMPDQESHAIASIENGKVVLRKGSEETNGFVMVQLADGRTGWTKSVFLLPSARPSTPEQPVISAPPAEHEQIAKLEMVQPQARTASGSVPSAKRQEADGKMPPLELWGIGFIGMLIGLLIGGKAGMVYATKSIHERYVVID